MAVSHFRKASAPRWPRAFSLPTLACMTVSIWQSYFLVSAIRSFITDVDCSELFGSAMRSLTPSRTMKSGWYRFMHASKILCRIGGWNSLNMWMIIFSELILIGNPAMRWSLLPIFATCPGACSVSIQSNLPVPLGLSSPIHPSSFRNAPAIPEQRKLFLAPGRPMTNEKFPRVHTGKSPFDTSIWGLGMFKDKSRRLFLIASITSEGMSAIGFSNSPTICFIASLIATSFQPIELTSVR